MKARLSLYATHVPREKGGNLRVYKSPIPKNRLKSMEQGKITDSYKLTHVLFFETDCLIRETLKPN